MKKSLFVGALLLGALSFTSCKKDYTCKVTSKDPFSGQEISLESEHKDLKKKDADKLKKSCESGGGVWSTK